jgi:hypothetical protein
MTSQHVSDLVRERTQLQSALRNIRRIIDNPSLDDASKSQKIRSELSKVKAFIPD